MSKNKRGRKSKYCPEIVQKIIEKIKLGLTEKDAYTLAGINHDSFYKWKKNKPEFAEKLKKAETELKQKHLARIQEASIKTWTASAWLLERKFPEEFSLRSKFEHSGKIDGDIKISVIKYNKQGGTDGGDKEKKGKTEKEPGHRAD